MFNHLQDSRTLPHMMVAWEDECHPSKCPTFLLPPALWAEHYATGYGISLRPAGVSRPSFVSLQLLVYPQPSHQWGGVGSRNSLGFVSALLSNC